jgi:hypothetical protein
LELRPNTLRGLRKGGHGDGHIVLLSGAQCRALLLVAEHLGPPGPPLHLRERDRPFVSLEMKIVCREVNKFAGVQHEVCSNTCDGSSYFYFINR